MKKIISYSVYGDKPMYVEGVFKNIELALEIYPDWISRFYLMDDCHHLQDKILSYPSTEVVLVKGESNNYATMYRFLPMGDKDVERFISRDTDSRLCLREKVAVDEWVESGKKFHVMHDHPYHYSDHYPVLAGMWGSICGIFPKIDLMIKEWIQNSNDFKGVDQVFLANLYKYFMVYDVRTHNMPDFILERNLERDKIYYIGQPVDENDNFCGNWENDLKLLGILL